MSERQSKNRPINTQQKPSENEKTEMKAIVAQLIANQFSGPIPPPDIMAGYDQVLPGSAERILAMAERQPLHRQQGEMLLVKAQVRDSLIGEIFAFVLGITALAAAVGIAMLIPATAGAVGASILGV